MINRAKYCFFDQTYKIDKTCETQGTRRERIP